jgi:transposase
MVHRNAPLSDTGRLRLARCVVDEGWSLRRVAERFQVSVTTATGWSANHLPARHQPGARGGDTSTSWDDERVWTPPANKQRNLDSPK